MKIIHIIIGLNTGGAELMLKRLIESHQSNSSYHHSVVSLTTTGKVGMLLEEMGVEVNALGMHSVFEFPRVFCQLVHLMRSERPYIVHTWLYHADLIGGLAAKIGGVSNIVWGIRTTELKKGSYATLSIRKLLAWLSYWIPKTIVVVADRAKQKHISLNYDASKMVVIPNGFNVKYLDIRPELVATFRQLNTLNLDDFVIGCVGRWSHEKGQDVFIKSAGVILDRFPECKFLMVGLGLESTNQELVSLIQKYARMENFILLGERSDVSVCLKVMDLFCLPSRSEGFPNVLGEAMLAGLPCVATDSGDSSILGGNEVPIAEVDNATDLAFKLLGVMAKSRLDRVQIGQRLSQRIIDFYSIQTIANRYQVLYEELERNY